MFKYDEDTDNCIFLCAPERRWYKLPLPEARRRRCCGSSHGWMVLLDGDQGGAFALNPLTRDSIPLPSIAAFPTMSDIWLEGDPDDNPDAVHASESVHDCVLEKIIFSGSPAIEGTVALALVSERIVFCRVGDPAWTVVDELTGCFTDAIFCDGKFYVVDSYAGLYTLEVGSNPMVTTLIQPLSVHPILRYIAELDGVIFMLKRIRHECDPQRHICGPTVAFEIFQLEKDEGIWREVSDIGEKSLFLGVNQSLFLCPSEFGYLKDCIYYTDDFCWQDKGDGADADHGCMRNDLGIYNTTDDSGNLSWCVVEWSSHIWPTPKWVTPSLC